MKALGRMILVELHDCARQLLTDEQAIREIMIDAVSQSGATIVTHAFHTFNPHGVSGVVVIAESHVAIHTWPEYGYAAVDFFTCGQTIDPWVIQEVLQNRLLAANVSNTEIRRGFFPSLVPNVASNERAPAPSLVVTSSV